MTNDLLLEKLCALLPAQFEEVMFHTDIPNYELHNQENQLDRAKELIEKCEENSIDLVSILNNLK